MNGAYKVNSIWTSTTLPSESNSCVHLHPSSRNSCFPPRQDYPRQLRTDDERYRSLQHRDPYEKARNPGGRTLPDGSRNRPSNYHDSQ